MVAKTVVVAPDSFKGTITATDAAAAIARGWQSVRPRDTIAAFPQADGGEGTLDAVEASVAGSVRHRVPATTGPNGLDVEATWLELPGGVAVVELAQSSGLTLSSQLDALGATTRGLGEVIAAALATDPTSLIVGLGGSASTDGGSGALSALGLRLFDGAGDLLPDGGGPLARIASIDASALVAPPDGGVVLLSDVTAPLLGPHGAAAVYGPQKGATLGDIPLLEHSLNRFARLLGGDPMQPGVGAAGGTGFGFASAWHATVTPGADYLAKLTGLTKAMKTADFVLTGEGRFDAQSLTGKVVGRIIGAAKCPVGVVAGQLSAVPRGAAGEALWAASLTRLAGSEAEAMRDPERWLHEAGAQAARELGEA
jgi:glycerate 2-kinase